MYKILYLMVCVGILANAETAAAQGRRYWGGGMPPQPQQFIHQNAGATQMYPMQQRYYVPPQQLHYAPPVQQHYLPPQQYITPNAGATQMYPMHQPPVIYYYHYR